MIHGERTIMNKLMPNLSLLRANMIQENWRITAFNFSYNQIHYTVTVQVINPIPKNTFWRVILTFYDLSANRILTVQANDFGLDITSLKFIDFFKIKTNQELSRTTMRQIFESFYQHLQTYIPVRVETLDSSQKSIVVKALDKHDSSKGIYCFGVKRNPIINGMQTYRSIYNDNKTRLLRKDVYDTFGDDKTISFCYSEDSSKENTLSEILYNFAKREH